MERTTARKQQNDAAEKWMSVLAASKALGETRHRVLTRIVAGELVGQKIAGRTVVTVASVARVKKAKDDGGAAK